MAIPDGKPATDFSAMNREWVRAVAAEAGGLPSVSGDDNGKVLTVVSGEWEAATASGGGIPAPASPSDGDVLTYDSTTSSWVAEAPSGGGGVTIIEPTVTYHLSDDYAEIDCGVTVAQLLTALDSGDVLIHFDEIILTSTTDQGADVQNKMSGYVPVYVNTLYVNDSAYRYTVIPSIYLLTTILNGEFTDPTDSVILELSINAQ